MEDSRLADIPDPGFRIQEDPQEGFVILDFECSYLYVNDVAARQRNCSPSDLLGRKVLATFPCVATGSAYPKVLQCLRERRPLRDLQNLPGPGGAPRWLDLRMEPVPEGILIRSIDVTERIQQAAMAPSLTAQQPEPGPGLLEAFRAVQASEARYHAIFDGMSEGFALQEILLDDNGEPVDSRFLDVNAAFERLTGFTRSQVLARTSAEVLPPGPCWGPAFGEVARTGRSIHTEAYWPHGDRHFEIFSYSPLPGQFAVLFMDITSRREAEEKTRVQARVLQAINEVFHEAMVRKTQEELAERCLDVACRLTASPFGVVGVLNPAGNLDTLAVRHDGWDPQDLTRLQVLARMQNLPPSGYWGEVARSRRCQAGPAPETLARHPVPLHRVLGAPLFLGDQNLGFIGLANKAEDYGAQDLEMMESLSVAFVEALARKRSDLAVQDLNSRLEVRGAEMQAAMEELDSFSYSVSHDLRAPLRHIIGFSELLQRELEGQLSGKAAHYLETILTSSRHMGHLIDVLLAFSQSNRGALEKRAVDLGALVKEVIASMEPDLQNRRVAWTVESLPTVQADPVLLRSVVVNLLSNALKFTRAREEARIRIGTEVHDLETVVFVADNGAGFNPRYKDKLFAVFQRLHPAAQFEGSGVGLANVRRIILRHGGRTWATGVQDAGATFYFSLPGQP